jgi:NADH:ubiquinone oxidoreductase subunit 3 (subunit A)
MFTADLCLNLLVLTQPLLLALLLFMISHQGIFTSNFFFKNLNLRYHSKSIRFFECAAYSRLVGHLRYNIQALSLLAVFIIYDVDLFFFIAEVLTFDTWTIFHLCLWLFYVLLFFFGIWYDSQRSGFF